MIAQHLERNLSGAGGERATQATTDVRKTAEHPTPSLDGRCTASVRPFLDVHWRTYYSGTDVLRVHIFVRSKEVRPSVTKLPRSTK